MHDLCFVPLPHNREYELDLHRPHIDDVRLRCACGGEMARVPEVVDCWVESGSMPFAEYHYPFENRREFEKRAPGDFVAEYAGQIRTWYYYMHVLSTVLFGRHPFNNVVNTGTVLAADGAKISKSKGNYTDPLALFDRFGADAVRYYLMTSVLMQSEDFNFSDGGVKETHNRILNILWNVVTFYEMYAADCDGATRPQESENALDRWVLARLEELKREMTRSLDNFDTIRAGRPVRDFVSDFSTWYLRRSRIRFKETARIGHNSESSPTEQTRNGAESEDERDKQFALATTRFVLLELSKLLAPFTPFLAESVYRAVGGEKESVHLDEWPAPRRSFLSFFHISHSTPHILEEMEEVRRIVSSALEYRSTAGVKVRQPLATLTVRGASAAVAGNEQYARLIQDEVNVKKVVFEKSDGWEVELDTALTSELEAEGAMRDLLRAIQDLRKKEGLAQGEPAALSVRTDDAGKRLIEQFRADIAATASLSELRFSDTLAGEEMRIGKMVFVLQIKK